MANKLRFDFNYSGGKLMKYQGYDWAELAREFGTFAGDCLDEITLEKTRQYLLENHFTDNNAYVADEIRLFLTQLYDVCLKAEDDAAPIWRGLLEVKDDFILVKYTYVLLEHMWY